MRIVFMGTPDFSVPALHKLVKGDYDVVAVYTRPDKPVGRGRTMAVSPVKKSALAHGLNVLQPASLRDPTEVERLAALKPDVIILVAFGQILPQAILDIPAFGCLNIHPSLLPKYRGPTPIPAAILAGDDDTGVTIILMDAGLDMGPVLSQLIVEIEPRDTTELLSAKLAQAGARLLVETLPLWFDKLLTPQPQHKNTASYTRRITKEDGEIDWRLPAEVIWRRVRAFYPWPVCYTWWRGRLLRIIEAVPLHKEGVAVTGKVSALPSGLPASAGVDTGDGILGLVRVQLEGKRIMTIDEFLRGQRDFIGEVLGAEKKD